MSLFNDMTALSHQHPDAGQYTFVKPELQARLVIPEEPEPAPMVSLYNLLDHSPEHLRILWDAVDSMEQRVRPHKLAMADTYTTLVAWMAIIKTAAIEASTKDSEAWAEKTAKEIKEADNQFQAQQDSGGTL